MHEEKHPAVFDKSVKHPIPGTLLAELTGEQAWLSPSLTHFFVHHSCLSLNTAMCRTDDSKIHKIMLSLTYCAKLLCRIYFLSFYINKLVLLFHLFESMKSYSRVWKKKILKSTCLNLNPSWMLVITYVALAKFFLSSTKPQFSHLEKGGDN